MIVEIIKSSWSGIDSRNFLQTLKKVRFIKHFVHPKEKAQIEQKARKKFVGIGINRDLEKQLREYCQIKHTFKN
ncbi:MAG: hypothetical protein ACFFCZ_27130 [Promethearchaeota archaeon]